MLYFLFFSVIVHEIFHGLAAKWCGDDTAQDSGRLSFSPFAHISITGTILVPLALYLLKAPAVFGWAKPVPVNPVKFKNFPRDQVGIAMAVPMSNFVLAYISFNLYFLLSIIFSSIYTDTYFDNQLDLFAPVFIPDIAFANIWFFFNYF